MTVEILNLKHSQPSKPYDFIVDRRSPVGNPYYLQCEETRDFVCDQYDMHFNAMLKTGGHEFMAYLELMRRCLDMYGKVRLFCWCVPKRCHAETIKAWLLR